MKKLILSIITFLILTVQKPNEANAQTHPGPRLTCPICNALMVKDLVGSSKKLAKVPRPKKLEIVRKNAPHANPADVVNIIDQLEALELQRIPLDQDASFRSYIIEFNSEQNNLFKIKSTVNDFEMSGSNVNTLLTRLNAINDKKNAVYLLVDDIYSKRALNFYDDVALFNASTRNDKFKYLGCDITVNGTGRVSRLGSTFLTKGAVLDDISEITQYTGRGASEYQATAQFRVAASRVKVTFFAKIKSRLQNFITTLTYVFRTSPDASIAKAINRSRYLTNVNITAVFEEAGLTQFVKRRPTKADIRKFSPDLILLLNRRSKLSIDMHA